MSAASAWIGACSFSVAGVGAYVRMWFGRRRAARAAEAGGADVAVVAEAEAVVRAAYAAELAFERTTRQFDDFTERFPMPQRPGSHPAAADEPWQLDRADADE